VVNGSDSRSDGAILVGSNPTSCTVFCLIDRDKHINQLYHYKCLCISTIVIFDLLIVDIDY
jgi:hypothetical protein